MQQLPFENDEANNKPIENKQSGRKRRRWDIYNVAKTEQKRLFPILLRELCLCIEEPEKALGRPRLSLPDMIFCCVLKGFLKSQSRQLKEDLCEMCRKGFIHKVPHFNSVSKYLGMPSLTAKLIKLIEISSLPLELIEVDFAVDSTGLSTHRYARWLDERDMQEHARREWIKVHLICGVKTKIVASVITTLGSASDNRQFGRLVEVASRNFNMQEISADKAYLGAENMRYALLANAKLFVPFKSNNKLDAEYKSPVWQQALYMFLHKQAEFRLHYNKRNNVETAFHMIKSGFGSHLLTVSRDAQYNEALCKVICHNICVLIQAVYEFGIKPDFCSEASYGLKSRAKTLGQALDKDELAKVQNRIPVAKNRKRKQSSQPTEIQESQLLLFNKDSPPPEK
jgi:transposase